MYIPTRGTCFTKITVKMQSQVIPLFHSNSIFLQKKGMSYSIPIPFCGEVVIPFQFHSLRKKNGITGAVFFYFLELCCLALLTRRWPNLTRG